MFFIYLHRRPDNGNVFYIGRGKQYNDRSKKFSRAYKSDRRNNIWNGIVAKNNGEFIVEILLECETIEDAVRLEIEAIAAFGKIIDGTGPLCNLTDGGEGAEGFIHSEETRTKLRAAHARNPNRLDYLKTEEFRRKISELNKGNKYSLGLKPSDETRAKMSNSQKGKHGRKIINKQTGEIYNSVEEASVIVGIHKQTLYKYLQGKRINYTSLRYV